jgi:hypothetical protein
MGVINIEGLGSIQIAGDTPTEKEQQTIIEAMKTMPASDKEIDAKTDSFLSSPSFARIALEVGLGIGGSLVSGGAALPVTLARWGMLARPFLTQLAKSAAGSAVGSGVGAVAAQPIDPKDDVVKEVIRAAGEGLVGEAVGAPLSIKAFQTVAKLVKPKIKLLEAAELGEEVLQTQIQKISKAKPGEYSKELVEAAKKAMFTPGVKADSQFIDIMENITEKSLFGSGELVATKEAAKAVTKSALDDFVDPLVKNADQTATGQLFIDAIQDSKKHFFTQAKANYDSLNKTLEGLGKSEVIDITKYNKALRDAANSLPKGGINTPNALKLLTNNTYDVNKITFKEANDLRSDILALGRAVTETDTKQYKIAQRLIADELTKSIDKAAIPASIKKQYDTAQAFYKDGINKYNDKIIEKIMSRSDPKDAYRAIVSSSDKPATIANAQAAMQRIFGKNSVEYNRLNNSLKGEVLQGLLDKAVVEDAQYGGRIVADKMEAYLKKFNGTFKQLFNEREVSQLNKITNAIAVANGRIAKTGGLPGGVFIQLKQAGAAGSILQFGGAGLAAGAGLPIAAVSILAGPKLISKLLTSPKFNQYLIEGYTAQNATKAGVAFRQIVGRAVADGDITKDEGEAAIRQSEQIEAALKANPPAKLAPGQETRLDKIEEAQKITTAPKKPVMGPVNTNVTTLPPRSAPITSMTPMTSQQIPTAGGITNIPQERIQDYTNLFGRI